MDSYLQTLVERAVKKGLKKPAKKKAREMDEIVDDNGAILGSKIPPDVDVATVTAQKTTDDTVQAARQPANYGDNGMGGNSRYRYWGESDMSASLGYEETLGKDKSYAEAKKYFTQELGFDEPEAEERLAALGYVKKAEDKVRLVEKDTFFEAVIDHIVQKRGEINPIILRQVASLKETLAANGLSVDDILPYLHETPAA